MLLKTHIDELLNMDAATLSRIVRNSGYKNAKFDTCEFLGITNSGDFCYKAKYTEDSVYDFTKIYVWRDATGDFVAEF